MGILDGINSIWAWNKFQGLSYSTGKIQKGYLPWFSQSLYFPDLNNLIKYTIMLLQMHLP